jgi:hypothetical protein
VVRNSHRPHPQVIQELRGAELWGLASRRGPRAREISYPVFMQKPGTHRMGAYDHLFHTHGLKVFTDNQMSRIKYIYYINNVSKD